MAKDDATLSLTEDQRAQFARGFLDRYLTPAFGSLTKSELDLLVFSLLHEVGYFRPSDSQYDIARRLRLTPTRVRSLTMQMQLRDTTQTESSLVARIVDCLSTARFVKDGAMISFGVEDPLLSADIAARLKSQGAITDSSFNREIVKIPRDAFADLVGTLLPPDRREIVRKALVQAGVPDGSWKGVLRGAFSQSRRKTRRRGGRGSNEGSPRPRGSSHQRPVRLGRKADHVPLESPCDLAGNSPGYRLQTGNARVTLITNFARWITSGHTVWRIGRTHEWAHAVGCGIPLSTPLRGTYAPTRPNRNSRAARIVRLRQPDVARA